MLSQSREVKAEIGRFAVIPTRNRHSLLAECINSLRAQVDLIVVVDNGSEPEIHDNYTDYPVLVMRDPTQPPNLSALWNLGLRRVASVARSSWYNQWDVAVLNDDATIPPGWFVMVSDAMRKHGAAAGCSGGYGDEPVVYGPEAPPAIHTRLQGWAFMLRGEAGLYADEQFGWWCGDDDLSMRARRSGGLVVVPGLHTENKLANSTTDGVLAAQSARDMQTFVDKWGVRPW